MGRYIEMTVEIAYEGQTFQLDVESNMTSRDVARKVEEFIDLTRLGDVVPVPNFVGVR